MVMVVVMRFLGWIFGCGRIVVKIVGLGGSLMFFFIIFEVDGFLSLVIRRIS